MDNINFDVFETDFNYGDEIFMYTDGITEAQNKDEELYGENRLLNILNTNKNISLENICKKVKQDIEQYAQETEQSDDITMLCFKYYGKENTYRNVASKQNYKHFSDWLNDNINKFNIADDKKQKIELSFEEIYTNIFSYAYPDSEGEVEISIRKDNDDIILEFTDWGAKYNPLEKPDPDINQPPENRSIGGLGIFMVKQLAKDVNYSYDNANILKLTF